MGEVEVARQPSPLLAGRWAPTIRLLAGGAIFFCLVAGLSALATYPGELSQRATAHALTQRGEHTVATDVERNIDLGQGGFYVTQVRATFITPSGDVTGELSYIEDSELEQPEGWLTRGPYSWWEPAPAASRYAQPLSVTYLPDEPTTVMADRDISHALKAGRNTPWQAAVLLAPPMFASAAPRARSWLLKPLRANRPNLREGKS
jgi:hypothetical protein